MCAAYIEEEQAESRVKLEEELIGRSAGRKII
jgi:hypothetical protein